MTGRTNIIPTTTAPITEEQAFDLSQIKWNVVRLNSTLKCERFIHENGTYVAVFSDGYVAWSSDGVSWDNKKLGEYHFYNIFYDGTQFIFCGGSDTGCGIIIYTEDFVNFNSVVYDEYESTNYKLSFIGIYVLNETYCAVAKFNSDSNGIYSLRAWSGNSLDSLVETTTIISKYKITSETDTTSPICRFFNQKCYVLVFENISSFIYGHVYLCNSSDGINYSYITMPDARNLSNYYLYFDFQNNYYYAYQYGYFYRSLSGATWTKISQVESIRRIVAIGEQLLLLGTPNLGIVINEGESIAEKTADDYVTVMEDVEINDALYDGERLILICEGGVVLYSSYKGADPEVEAIKTMSAKKALEDAKIYTNNEIAKLKEYIDGLLG